MSSRERVTVSVQVVRQTPEAVCVENMNEFDVWLPKSQVQCDEGFANLLNGCSTILRVPEWLAKREGLI